MAARLTDFSIPQLRILQQCISEKTVENNHHIDVLENLYEFTELSKHRQYMNRLLVRGDLNQLQTQITEAIVDLRTIETLMAS